MTKTRTQIYFRIAVVPFSKMLLLASQILKKAGSDLRMNTTHYNFKKICNSSKVDQRRLRIEYVECLNKTRTFNHKMCSFCRIVSKTHNSDRKTLTILISDSVGRGNKSVLKIASFPNKAIKIRSSSFLWKCKRF